MPATKRRIALEIVATDTHCEELNQCCPHYDRYEYGGLGMCGALENLLEDVPHRDPVTGYARRLPECIEAERRAKEGQSEAVRDRCAECRDLCSECSD